MAVSLFAQNTGVAWCLRKYFPERAHLTHLNPLYTRSKTTRLTDFLLSWSRAMIIAVKVISTTNHSRFCFVSGHQQIFNVMTYFLSAVSQYGNRFYPACLYLELKNFSLDIFR